MLSRLAALVLVLCLSNVPAALAAQASYAVTTKDAPLFVVKTIATPLRIAKHTHASRCEGGGRLVLVEFEDPHGGAGRCYLRAAPSIEAPEPVDVSIREDRQAHRGRLPAGGATMPGAPERAGMPAGLK